MTQTLRWLIVTLFVAVGLSQSPAAFARMQIVQDPLAFGFTPIDLISPTNFAKAAIAAAENEHLIKHFCDNVAIYYKRYNWQEYPCSTIKWRANLKTKAGHPLIYADFGSGRMTTLLLGGVHADELTPVPLAFRTAAYLNSHPEVLRAENAHVIVAPLVNPDGFMRNIPTRTNGNGVDLNRNFFTLDWYERAKKLWQERRERATKHFPGYFPNSEVETIFQIQLIDNFHPDKILTIHAPLGFLDYDGPGGGPKRPLTKTEQVAKRLVTSISEKSQNYKIVDYTFYPGSLGNYAGQERHIPTVTLELETTNPKMLELYWKQFFPGILQSISYPYVTSQDVDNGNATPFSADYRHEKTI